MSVGSLMMRLVNCRFGRAQDISVQFRSFGDAKSSICFIPFIVRSLFVKFLDVL